MNLHEEHQRFLFKHEGERIKRKFLQTLWVLRLNPNPPRFSLLEQLHRAHGSAEEAIKKIEGKFREKGR